MKAINNNYLILKIMLIFMLASVAILMLLSTGCIKITENVQSDSNNQTSQQNSDNSSDDSPELAKFLEVAKSHNCTIEIENKEKSTDGSSHKKVSAKIDDQYEISFYIYDSSTNAQNKYSSEKCDIIDKCRGYSTGTESTLFAKTTFEASGKKKQYKLVLLNNLLYSAEAHSNNQDNMNSFLNECGL